LVIIDLFFLKMKKETMMTNEFLPSDQILVSSKPLSVHYTGNPPSAAGPASWLPNPKRKVLQRCCSRLAASGLPES
jgi:hypothetical protein